MTAISPSIIAVEELRVRRGERLVLQVPHVAIEEGEVFAIIGPNGAGKSTLLQALALLLPAAMRYRFGGRLIALPREAPAIRRQMAAVFQEPLLLSMTVFENVALGLRLRRIEKGEIATRVAHALQKLGIAHLAPRSARSLSGGEAQRVSLARALVLQPRVLLLDEPFSALDVLARAALIEDLRPLLRAGNMTAILVTHNFAEISLLADRVAVLIAGEILQVGSPHEIFAHPADETVRQLVRAAGIH